MTDRIRRMLVAGLGLAFGVLALRAFFDAAIFYADFRLVLGTGTHAIPRDELIYSVWFMFLGSLAAGALGLGLYFTGIPDRLLAGFDLCHKRTRMALVGLTLVVFIAVVCFRVFVLLDAPVADDESTYLFIAQTLQHGRLVNPVPRDSAFFANQFVVINSHGWFGKYPIGHPLLLAAADLLGARTLFGPLVTCLSLLVTYHLGKKMFDGKIGLVAAFLLAVSPHFLLTGATLLSQTTSTLFLLLGLYFAVCFLERRQTVMGALSALAFAYGALVRPFPGALFLFATFAVILFQPDGTAFLARLRANGRILLLLVLAAALSGVALLLINDAQTGRVLRTAYQEVHGAGMGVIDSGVGRRSMSVAASLLRQNLWLFGWPLSLLFIPFIRRNRYFVLLVAQVVAEYGYRVLFPKTVVSSTGPIYVTEIVPLLALASASGMVELARLFHRFGVRRAQAAIASSVSALLVVALLEFWPAQIFCLHRGAHAWRFPYEALEAEHVPKALVFADFMVSIAGESTWAYFPPNPSPSLDDDIVFVRAPKHAADPVASMRAFHRRHFPDRPAYVLRYDAKDSSFAPLGQAVESVAAPGVDAPPPAASGAPGQH
jgi:hypothetical protein